VRWWLPAFLCIGLAACGGDDAEPSAARTPTATAEARATPEPTSQEIRQAANRYLAAFGRSDWAGVCATLVPSERRHFDRRAGSCERAFAATEATKRERRLLRNSRAGEIRIGPNQAIIEITELGWREPFMRLYAIEERGAWGIARSRKQRES
jgi:hypothetical protein